MKKLVLASAALSLMAMPLISTPAFAQDSEAALQAIEDALPGALMHNPLAIDWDTRGDDKKVKVVDAATPNGKAISARVKKRKTNAWDVVVTFDLEDGVTSGDQIDMHFWARTAKAAAGKDTAEFIVFVGRNEEPYDNIISEEFAPSDEWKLHNLKGVATRDYGDGKVKVEFQLGRNVQTVEFGPVYVSNLGPAS